MSYKRRKAQHLAQEHEFYETDSGNGVAYGGVLDVYNAAYPGPRETLTVDAANHEIYGTDPDIRDRIDWAVGGEPGDTKGVSSVGVTDPQTVETHDFRGQMAEIRRMPDTNYGPVGTADHNSLLSLLYQMQESAAYLPTEISQQDILKAV